MQSLIYQLHLRELESEEALNEHLRAVLAKPTIEKAHSGQDNMHWVMDIPNPLVLERIRQLVRKSGHVSDGSFSPSIVKPPVNANAAVLAALVPEAKRDKLLVQARKIAHASEKMPLKQVLGEILRHAGGKLAGKAGEQLGEDLSKGLLELLKNGNWRVLSRFTELAGEH